jgi:hypothetical protein
VARSCSTVWTRFRCRRRRSCCRGFTVRVRGSMRA